MKIAKKYTSGNILIPVANFSIFQEIMSFHVPISIEDASVWRVFRGTAVFQIRENFANISYLGSIRTRLIGQNDPFRSANRIFLRKMTVSRWLSEN